MFGVKLFDSNILKSGLQFFVKSGLYFFLYHVDQAWANRRSQIFLIQKKLIKIEGCYLFMVGVTSFILS